MRGHRRGAAVGQRASCSSSGSPTHHKHQKQAASNAKWEAVWSPAMACPPKTHRGSAFALLLKPESTSHDPSLLQPIPPVVSCSGWPMRGSNWASDSTSQFSGSEAISPSSEARKSEKRDRGLEPPGTKRSSAVLIRCKNLLRV